MQRDLPAFKVLVRSVKGRCCSLAFVSTVSDQLDCCSLMFPRTPTYIYCRYCQLFIARPGSPCRIYIIMCSGSPVQTDSIQGNRTAWSLKAKTNTIVLFIYIYIYIYIVFIHHVLIPQCCVPKRNSPPSGRWPRRTLLQSLGWTSAGSTPGLDSTSIQPVMDSKWVKRHAAVAW